MTEIDKDIADQDRSQRKERLLWYLREQFFLCYYCMEPIDEKTATRDHVCAQFSGGTLEDGNMVLCCLRCNNTKDQLPYSFFMSLIDGSSPPLLRKNRRGYGWQHHIKRGGRQQIEITRLWHIRRALSRSGKVNLMPCVDLMASARQAYLAGAEALTPPVNKGGE